LLQRAIRLRKPDKGDFSISKLADMRVCFIEPAVAPDPAPVVCAYPPGLDLTPESQFLVAKGLQRRARCITDNVRIIRNLVQTRQAVGILPEYLCEDLLADRRLRVTPLPKRRDVWLLVQNHLKRDDAARIVIKWVRDCFRDFSRP
jgi:DNA-binding transcriptional LysR family regulator